MMSRLYNDQRHLLRVAGKVCVQRATGVSQVSAVVTMTMDLPFVGVVVAMLMMAVRSSRVRNRLRAGAR